MKVKATIEMDPVEIIDALIQNEIPGATGLVEENGVFYAESENGRKPISPERYAYAYALWQARVQIKKAKDHLAAYDVPVTKRTGFDAGYRAAWQQNQKPIRDWDEYRYKLKELHIADLKELAVDATKELSQIPNTGQWTAVISELLRRLMGK